MTVADTALHESAELWSQSRKNSSKQQPWIHKGESLARGVAKEGLGRGWGSGILIPQGSEHLSQNPLVHGKESIRSPMAEWYGKEQPLWSQRETWLQILHLVIQIWGNDSNSLSLSFIIYKVRIIIHPFCRVGVRTRDNVGTLFMVGKALAP